MQNGNVIEFYEPAPGALIFSEAGLAGTPMSHDAMSLDGLQVSEIFASLAPDREIPASLLAAEARALETSANRERQRPDFGSDNASLDENPSTYFSASYFQTNVCQYGDWSTCEVYIWDWAYAYCNNVDYFYAATAADIGNHTMQITGSNGYGGSWTVLDETWRYYWRSGSSFNARLDVLNAGGDRFHYHARCNW